MPKEKKGRGEKRKRSRYLETRPLSKTKTMAAAPVEKTPFVVSVVLEIEEDRVPAFLEAMKIDVEGSRQEVCFTECCIVYTKTY